MGWVALVIGVLMLAGLGLLALWSHRHKRLYELADEENAKGPTGPPQPGSGWIEVAGTMGGDGGGE